MADRAEPEHTVSRLRDWASRTQGCADWDDAKRRNDVWLGVRIGFIEGNVLLAPGWLFLLWLVIR